MTINPFSAPQASPRTSTPTTPSSAVPMEPVTMYEPTQLVRMKIMPTDRSMPAVSTTNVCAIATRARSTPLLAAVCTTLAVKPAGWLVT